MINSYLNRQIIQNFRYEPTNDQLKALNSLTGFLLSQDMDTILLLT